MKKPTACALAAALILLSPGLPCYEALAAGHLDGAGFKKTPNANPVRIGEPRAAAAFGHWPALKPRVDAAKLRPVGAAKVLPAFEDAGGRPLKPAESVVEKLENPQVKKSGALSWAALTGFFDAFKENGSPAIPEAPVPAPVLRHSLLHAPLAELHPAWRHGLPARSRSDLRPEPANGKGKSWPFKDPDRNKSFWRYWRGDISFLLAFEMYVVGGPFFMSSFTKNSLKDRRDARAENAEALKALIRRYRSLGRIAHWSAQAVSYLTVPLFSAHAQDGESSLRWLVRAGFTRAMILAGITGVFFATGILSPPVAISILLGLVALQSFSQGLHVTMEASLTTQIMGDKSVTDEERTAANSILNASTSVAAILGPAVAGRIALIRSLFGKANPGGAVIYGLYGLGLATAAFFFSGLKVLQGKSAQAAPAPGGAQPQEATRGLAETVKYLFASLRQGLAMILKNPYQRTMLGLDLVAALFSDPLVSNILPEFVEGVLKAHPTAVNGLLSIPAAGWILKGLTGTSMGYYGLLIVFGSLGGILATALNGPLTKLLARLGFKTEESRLRPLLLIALIQVPAFWAMVYLPSFWGLLLFYALQSLATAFMGILVSGLNQKTLGSYERQDIQKILVAGSFVSIAASIVSTLVYGFFLNNLAIDKALFWAAVATTFLGACRVLAPRLALTKEQRSRNP